jgi:hypothetical protein
MSPLLIIMLVAAAVFIYAVFVLPRLRLRNKPPHNLKGDYTIDDLYNANKIEREKELNRILDKISNLGIEKLTKQEKDFLEKNQ